MKPIENSNLKDWSCIKRINGLIRLEKKRSVLLENWTSGTESFKKIAQRGERVAQNISIRIHRCTRGSPSLASTLKGGLLWSFLTVHAGVHFHARVSKLASTVMSRFALGLRKLHVSVDSSAAQVHRQRANSVVNCGVSKRGLRAVFVYATQCGRTTSTYPLPTFHILRKYSRTCDRNLVANSMYIRRYGEYLWPPLFRPQFI